MTQRLSPRQMEIARLVAEGLADKVIAGILVMNEHTLDEHLKRIGEKLGVKDGKASRRIVITRFVLTVEAAPSTDSERPAA
jgi:DNA-binding NarL/FixJ family response regulator